MIVRVVDLSLSMYHNTSFAFFLTVNLSIAPRGLPGSGENSIRLIGHHLPSLIPSTVAGENSWQQCVICANTSSRAKKGNVSRYECTECKIGLCVSDYFRDHHCLKYFKTFTLHICQ